MRKYIKSFGIFSLVYILAVSNPILAQEYDDMYFTKSDRKQTDFNLKVNRGDADRAVAALEDDDLQEVYLDKNVNPEYIAKYQVQSAKKLSKRNQEVDYYPEVNANNVSSKTGYFNNYNWRVKPYHTATFNTNFDNAYGFRPYNNFMYVNNPFDNVWISDFYSPYIYNPYNPFSYGLSSFDPWTQFYGGSWLSNWGMGRFPINNSSYYYNPGWAMAMMRTPYPTGWAWNTGITEGPKGTRNRVIGPRGSSGSKTVTRGAIVDVSSTNSNKGFRTTAARPNSNIRDFGNQNTQNEYLNKSVNQRGTNQSFVRSNSVEALSRFQSVLNSNSFNQRKTKENNQRSQIVANNRSLTTQNKSSRRYYSTTMPERNDFNMPSKGDSRNTYQNRGVQSSSGSSSGVTTNLSSIPVTSRSYTSSYNSSSGVSRNYSVPSNLGGRSSISSSGSRSSISSSGGRSSGGSSRPVKK